MRDEVEPIAWGDRQALSEAVLGASAILVTPAPGPTGCPAHTALAPILAHTGAKPDWIGYLSTTGVYGDRAGGWVYETGRLAAQSMEAARRVGAEGDWRATATTLKLPLTIHRLPGIYGPGRSPLDRLREGRARRFSAPGHVFSRIHVEDLATALMASIARPRPGGIYNVCDDEPAANSQVIAHAARLLGMEPPPETPLDLDQMTPQARRFYAETKRVSNALAKAELGWRPRYPTYREGLAAILAAGGQATIR